MNRRQACLWAAEETSGDYEGLDGPEGLKGPEGDGVGLNTVKKCRTHVLPGATMRVQPWVHAGEP